MDGIMGREILVDTSVIIDYFRKTKKNKTFFVQLVDNYSIVISNITKFELDIGICHTRQSAFLEELYTKISIIELNTECTDLAAELYRDLKVKNQLISLPDLLIAATAILCELPLATINLKHFQRIKQLTCIGP
jgi:tRNA(fMet)-specific endonuclease VapC